MADEMQRIFEEAGYTYPGSPEAGARLLLSEVTRSQSVADAESKKYSGLVSELSDALEDSPLHGAPGDPVKHAALLCKLVQKKHVSDIANAVKTLRARHTVQSEAHPKEDDEFLFALDDLTDPDAAEKLGPVVEASVAYWQALQSGDHARVAVELTKWSQVLSAHLDPEL